MTQALPKTKLVTFEEFVAWYPENSKSRFLFFLLLSETLRERVLRAGSRNKIGSPPNALPKSKAV